MRALGYVRCSTEEQAMEGVGLRAWVLKLSARALLLGAGCPAWTSWKSSKMRE